jgi:hypothetical protein
MPIHPGLVAIEKLYLEINLLNREQGSLADYLDRGRPSPEQAAGAHAAVSKIQGRGDKF